MMYATLDVDLLDDPAFVRLEEADPSFPWLFIRCVQIAKRANRRGMICGRQPYQAIDLAIIHSRRVEDESRWEAFIASALQLGLLVVEEDCLAIADWSRWHRKPSDEPESCKERVALHRVTSRYNALPANVTHVTPQTRTEQTRSEQSSSSYSSSVQESAKVAKVAEEAAADSCLTFDRDVQVQLRSRIAQVLQESGMRARIDIAKVLVWSGEDLRAGRVLVEDVQTAIRFGVDQTLDLQRKGQEIRQPWKYALAIAESKLDDAVRRRRMTEEAREEGLPIPRPFRYTPEDGAL